MTYLELINHFWKIHESVNFSPHEIALYFYILKEANRQGWPEPFVCPNRSLCLGLGIADSTLIRCRDRLVGNGVLAYKSAKDKRKAPVYYFHCASSDASRNDSRDASSRASRDASRNASIIKDIKNKRPKNKSPIPPDKPGECVLDLGLDETKKKKSGTQPKQEMPPPTLEEVKTYFLSQSADSRLEDWEAEAEIFFNNFTATDWVDASGRKIKHWDSRANRWILEKEQRKKQSQTNGQFRQQAKAPRYDPRRGAYPDNPTAEDWDAPI